MLPKIYRLPAATKFDRSQTISLPFFGIKTQENTLGYNRIGFVVSKKIDKRAVVRNRLKRILREAVKDFAQQSSTGRDVLFIVKKSFFSKSASSIFTMVKLALKKAL